MIDDSYSTKENHGQINWLLLVSKTTQYSTLISPPYFLLYAFLTSLQVNGSDVQPVDWSLCEPELIDFKSLGWYF